MEKIRGAVGASELSKLATAVAIGIALGAVTTLFVLPGLFTVFLRGYQPRPATPDEVEAEPATGPKQTAVAT